MDLVSKEICKVSKVITVVGKIFDRMTMPEQPVYDMVMGRERCVWPETSTKSRKQAAYRKE